jgi:DNA-binding MarR family transcriptional regulator
MDDGLTDAEARLWRPYLVVTARLEAMLSEELRRRFAIDHDDFRMLVRIDEGEERPVRMSELAYFTSWDRSKVTYRVKRMEALGLVTREGDPHDRRGVNATLTARGSEVLAAARPRYTQMLRSAVFEQVDESEREVLARVFTHLMGSLGMDWHAFEH